MNKKRKLIIAASVLSMAAVGGIAVGATTALFHEDAEFNVHIKAGKLDVGFYVEHMYADEYDSSSNSIVAFTNADDMVTATNFGEANIVSGKGLDLAKYGEAEFTIDEVYPTMAGEIDYLVENNSKVAVNLTSLTETTVLDAEGSEVTGDAKTAFLSQFEIVSTFEATQLDEYDAAAADVDDIYRFKVTFNFKDDENNNDYMGYSVKICTSITATQVAKASN